MRLKPINDCVRDGDVPSRSWVYRKFKEPNSRLKAKKVGNRTHLDMDSVEEEKAALPDYVPLAQRIKENKAA